MTDQLSKWMTSPFGKGEWDPGQITLDAMRHFEPMGRAGRRQFLTAMGAVAAAASTGAFAQIPGPVSPTLNTSGGKTYPPQHSTKVMEPVNIHEIQAVSARTLDNATYDYITGGAEDEYTLVDNIKAYELTRLRQHVGVDVSKIDTSVEILGVKLDYPIMLDPDDQEPGRAGRATSWPRSAPTTPTPCTA